jgi:hypothetical protein
MVESLQATGVIFAVTGHGYRDAALVGEDGGDETCVQSQQMRQLR